MLEARRSHVDPRPFVHIQASSVLLSMGQTTQRRTYKHITWRQTRRQSGWIVQHQGRTIGGFHSSEDEAAETLRRALGLKRKSQLARVSDQESTRKSGQRSAFQGVSYHRQLRRYVLNSMAAGKTYATGRQAAAARASILGSATVVLKKPSAVAISRRLRFIRKVYMPALGKQWLFADLSSALKHATESRMMFAAEPGLEMLSIQLKYEPWRVALLSSWKQMRSAFPLAGSLDVTSVNDPVLHERATRVHALLVRTVQTVAKTKIPECWGSNCSRIVGRHSAPQMVLHHLGVLEKGVSISFEHGCAPTWRLAQSVAEVASSVTKLEKMIWGWRAVRGEIHRAPHTCSEWCQFQRSAFSKLKTLKIAIPRLATGKESSYVRSWTFRTLMLMLMEHEGRKRLVVDAKISAWAFCTMCPDQQKHLQKLYFALRPASVADFLKKCGCRGIRPELFSCLACFAGDAAWDEFDDSKLKVKLWQQSLEKYYSKNKICAIPAVLMKEL